MPFQRLIRFEDENGEVCLGNLSEEIHTQKIEGSKVHLLHDDGANSYSVGHETRTVKKVRWCLISLISLTPLLSSHADTSTIIAIVSSSSDATCHLCWTELSCACYRSVCKYNILEDQFRIRLSRQVLILCI